MRFFDGLTTIKETFIFQGALLEFYIKKEEKRREENTDEKDRMFNILRDNFYGLL